MSHEISAHLERKTQSKHIIEFSNTLGRFIAFFLDIRILYLDMPFKIKNRVFHKITCLFRTPCHIFYTIPMFFYMIIHTLYLLESDFQTKQGQKVVHKNVS